MKYYLILLLLIVSCACITIERPIVVEPTKPHECGCLVPPFQSILPSLPSTPCCPLNETCTADMLPCDVFTWRYNTELNHITVPAVACRAGDECDIISTGEIGEGSESGITFDNPCTIGETCGYILQETTTFSDEFLTGLPLVDLDHLKIGGCFGPHHALRTPPCCSPDHPTDETCDEDCK